MRLQRLLSLLLLSWLQCFAADTNNLFQIIDGELFTNSISLGTNNFLIVTNGGKVTAVTLSTRSGLQLNQVYIDGIGTTWSNTIRLSGGSNLLSIANGALVTGQVGLQGSNSTILLSNGAQILGGITMMANAKSNYFDVSGASIIENGMVLAGTGNYFNFRDGSILRGGVVGSSGSAGNTLEFRNTTISNGGNFSLIGDLHQLVFTNHTSVSFSAFVTSGRTNQITISDDSSLNSDQSFSQSHPSSITGGGTITAKTFSITAPTATESLLLDGVHVKATDHASLASDAFLNEAQFQTPNLAIAKTVTVSGPAAFVETTRVEGQPLVRPIMNILNGAALRTDSVTNLSVALSDPGSQWDLAQPYLMASGASGYSITLSNRARANLHDVYIGYINTNLSSSDSRLSVAAQLIVDGESRIQCDNLWIGLNSGANSAVISGGGTLAARNLAVGYFEAGSRQAPRGMWSNSLSVSGNTTRLTIASNLWVGHRGSTNILRITDGAAVSCASAEVGYYKDFDTDAKAIVQISGLGSNLRVENFYDSKPAAISLEVSDGGVFSAGNIILPNTVLASNGQILGDHAMTSYFPNVTVLNGGKISAPVVSLGNYGSGGRGILVVSNANSGIIADKLDLLHIDDPSVLSTGDGVIFVADHGELRARNLTLGVGIRKAHHRLTVNGGSIKATSSDGSGSFEMQNSQLSLLTGTVEVDHLVVSNTNTWIYAGDVHVGGFSTLADGEFRINGGHGITEELRGTNTISSLSIGESPTDTCSVAILQGTTTVSNLFTVGSVGHGQIVLSNALVMVDQLAISGSGLLRMDQSANLHARTITLNNGASFHFHLNSPATNGLFVVDSTSRLGGEIHFELGAPTNWAPGASLRLLTSASVVGRFSNAQDGSRVPSDDGKGSFVINYLPDGILLNDFQAAQGAPTISAAFNVTNQTLTVSFPTQNGQPPAFEESTDLIHWTPLTPANVSTSNGMATWWQVIGEAAGARFFRAVN